MHQRFFDSEIQIKMERHPLLNELLEICNERNVEPFNAFITFDAYQELSEVRKFSNLKYFFSEELKLFYLTGQKNDDSETTNVFLPLMSNYEITPVEMDKMQQLLSPQNKQIFLYIRDGDSTSTCYSLTGDLVKPDSPDVCKIKKESETKTYQFYRNIQNNKKQLYVQALKRKATDS